MSRLQSAIKPSYSYRKMDKNEIIEWKKYRKPNQNYNKCKVNELVIFPNNSYEHEKAKFDLYWKLRQEGHNVLTECELIETKERCDLVDLTTQERVEIENSTSKRGHRHPKNVNVYWYDLQRKRNNDEIPT